MRFSLNYTGIRNCPLKIEISQLPDGFRLDRLVGDWLLKVANIKDKSNGATVYAPGGGVLPYMDFSSSLLWDKVYKSEHLGLE